MRNRCGATKKPIGFPRQGAIQFDNTSLYSPKSEATVSTPVSGPSRRSATRQHLVAIGGIADIERFTAGNDLQRLTQTRHRPDRRLRLVGCRFSLAPRWANGLRFTHSTSVLRFTCERREFITLLGGAAVAWPLVARAQQPAMTRVGITTIQPRTSPIYAAFDKRLRELGYIEGQNLVVDLLNPQNQAGGIAGAVAELLRRKVDIIVAPYESTLKSAIAATATVPIVMIAVDYDPLALGYIKSLSRPGGNVTGLFLQQPELAKKRLQLLTEALPGVQTATMFWD